MKGLSTILAMILIVIIVVALIGLTYTFAANLFTTTTNTATSSVETTTKNMDKMVSVIGSPSCAVSSNVTYTLKHGGATYPINVDRKPELTVMIDTSIISYDKTSETGSVGTANCGNCIGNVTLQPQQMRTYTTNSTTLLISGPHILYLISPAGEIRESFTC